MKKLPRLRQIFAARSFGFLLLAMTALPLGCAAVVGADDYQVGAVEGTAGTGVGQGGSDVGVGGNDGTGGSGTAGTRFGTGGSRFSDASVPADAAVMKPESSVTPPKGDAAKADVVVPDTGTGGKPVGSGESLCTTSCTGAGLTCQHTALGSSGICTYLCNDVSECDATHDCIGSSDTASKFDYACLKKCPTGTCPSGLSCLPTTAGPVCVPTDWLPKDLGLGDDCVNDAQCTTGQCANKPNGWCSQSCQAFDLCEGDYTDGTNYYDEYNWCMNVLGGYKCTPGCSGSATDCDYYPGTTCKYQTDIDGFSAKVCTF